MSRLGARILTLISLGVLLILTACGSGAANVKAGPSTIKIQDARGTVSLPGPAKRIAVQQWQFVEDLLAIGVQPTMIADDQAPGASNPLPAEAKAKLGKYTSLGSRLSPNMEVLSSQPIDLIIIDKNEQGANYDQFAKVAPTMVLDTWSWADFFPNLERIGKATGRDSKTLDVEKTLKGDLANARKQIAAKAAGARVLVAVPTATGLYPFTANSPQGGMMADMGLYYAYPEVAGKLTVQVNLEALPPLKPNAIFLAGVAGTTLVTDTWKSNALWTDLPAVQSGKVVSVDRGTWSLARGALALPLIIDETVKVVTGR